MSVNVDSIKFLRNSTGFGIMECKKALEDADGDIEKAKELLEKLGSLKATKKLSRDTKEGVIESYIHNGSRVGAIVELNCETDFVARTSEFKELAHDIAMQVAAMNPQYINSDDVPDEKDDTEINEDDFLVNQACIKDPSKTVENMISDAVGKMGENIRITRFIRFAIGE
ncbi:MAG: elongation factor Ts [Chloroflexota bacterium]|nr:MAG: elongation factor Ts [Chloroflexota bacterium]